MTGNIPIPGPTKPTDEDRGYCGLEEIIETGPLDPWWKRACQRHDASHKKLLAGLLEGSYLRVFWRFTTDIAKGMLQGAADVPLGMLTADPKRTLKGAFLVGTGPLYWGVGGVGGIFLAGVEERKINRVKEWEKTDES